MISFGDGYLQDAGISTIYLPELTTNKTLNILVHETDDGIKEVYSTELLIVKFISDTSLQIIANYGVDRNKLNTCSSLLCKLVFFN